MDESMKKFKIVYCHDVSTYTIWVTNDEGKWECKDAMSTFTKRGKRVKGINEDWGLVSERLIWMIDYWNTIGYRFLGIFDQREEEI